MMTEARKAAEENRREDVGNLLTAKMQRELGDSTTVPTLKRLVWYRQEAISLLLQVRRKRVQHGILQKFKRRAAVAEAERDTLRREQRRWQWGKVVMQNTALRQRVGELEDDLKQASQHFGKGEQV